MATPSPTVGSSLAPTQEMETDAIRAMQHIYRRLLDAMSHPGQVWQLIKHPHLRAESPIEADWMASLVMTLVDHEVSLHVVDAPLFNGMQDVVSRRTRVQITTIEAADFVVADVARFDADLVASIKIGSLDYPNDGATLVLQVGDLNTVAGPTMVLTGPGVNESHKRPLGDLTTGILAARNAATADYPLGIDLIVIDRSGRVMALPRTTVIAIRDGGQ